jgi:hypothetical protein
MEPIIILLNPLGDEFMRFAGPMLLQSSLLIVVLLACEALLRHRVRAVVRYGLWMLVLVKLVLPASLSVPTGIGYWLSPNSMAWLPAKHAHPSAAGAAPVPLNAVEDLKPFPRLAEPLSPAMAACQAFLNYSRVTAMPVDWAISSTLSAKSVLGIPSSFLS